MKAKRVLAIFGVILLLSMFVLLIVGALTATPESSALLKASLFTIIVIPILIYAYIIIYRQFKRKNDDENS